MHNTHVSFEESLIDHVEMLFEVAVGLTHDPGEAELLTEDTVAKALDAHKTGQLRIQLKPWLLSTLRDGFLAHRKQQSSMRIGKPAKLRPVAVYHHS